MENTSVQKQDIPLSTFNRCLGCMEVLEPASLSCQRCGWSDGSGPASVLHLAPGSVLLNSYVLGRVLGQGGFGITYIGWDRRLERKVAIKEYMPQMIASREVGGHTVIPRSGMSRADLDHGLGSFLNEGRLLARFSDHPCIVSVFNLFEANGTGYLVMGYLEGSTLSETLRRSGGTVSYETALDVMMRVLDGLREIHSGDLLHRDISPDNIYITRQGTVKILDFGAARFAVGERSQSLSLVLKEGFAPEEQYRRRGLQGPWTDVYAAAATFYRAITGITPPPALDRLYEDTLKPVSALEIPIPDYAESALLRALSMKAGDRFQSIESFQQALKPTSEIEAKTADEQKAGTSIQSKVFSTNRNGILGAVGSLILILLLVVAVLAIRAERRHAAELKQQPEIARPAPAEARRRADESGRQIEEQRPKAEEPGRGAEAGPERARPRVTLENVWTTHNEQRAAANGMVIHSRFRVFNLKQQTLEVIAFFQFDDTSAKLLENPSASCRTDKDQLCAHTMINPPNDDSYYSNVELFVPYSEFGAVFTNTGKWNLKYDVVVRKPGDNRATFARSDWQTFFIQNK